MEIDVIKIIMILSITITISLVIELNNLSNDIMNNDKKIPLYYTSKIFLNAIIGTTSGITTVLISDNIILVFVIAICGTFLGKRSFLIIAIIIKSTNKVFRDIDINKVLGEDDKNNDDDL